MMPIYRNATVNRRLYLRNKTVLLDFSRPQDADATTLEKGVDCLSVCALPPDIVSEGTHGLRLHAASLSDGSAAHEMAFVCRFREPMNLEKTPTLSFAFSAYDGEHDSRYFANVKENMYFVERPDPLLISHSYLTVTLLSAKGACTCKAELTDYGFNRIFMNFSGESVLDAVEGIRFVYTICEKAPEWQRVIKLDTVSAGREVDFTLHGDGMESLFSAQNATVVHHGGVLTLHCAENAAVALPDLTEAENTICDFFLPIKNTLLLRLRADVTALSLTVAFQTEENGGVWRAENRKTFFLADVDREKTVYLNLSDCAGAQGGLTDRRRLTKLLLLPDRACTIDIYKIAFEQEEPIRAVAGRFLSCTANPETAQILMECAIDPAFAGGTLFVYDGFMDVVGDDRETLSHLECIAQAKTDETGKVQLTAPLLRGSVSRLSSELIGALETADGAWMPLANRCVIENWRDFSEGNPYAFELPAHLYDVTDPAFGAKGDGYTDDTAAIQAALDVCAETGGTVLLPDTDSNGCDNRYGRRYLATNLRIHSHTELRIAPRAMLWQSDDVTRYRVPPRFGHNVSMTGVNWPANHSSGNYPLLYGFREQNIRITGGGSIRMCDTESRSADGRFRFIGDNVCIGCADRMHTVPVGLPECENVEITDLALLRSSGPFLIINGTRRVYVGNLRMDMAKCTGADGIWPCASDGVIFDRILMNTNDDGICLSANYNDPRDMLWYFAYPGWDHGTHHISLLHSRLSCYTFTGSAISFCIWGTDSPDLSRVEVNDIRLYDTVLEGRLSIGGWTDNPYYGVFPFDGSETDDFSPVKNVSIHKCELRSPTGIDNLRITNMDSDCGLHAPAQFEYGDFKRRVAEQNPGWVTGLSNWSYTTREAVEQISLYDVPCATLRKLRGRVCDLWQGLYLCAGTHRMTFRYKAAGAFLAFVRTADGEPIAETRIYQIPNGYSKGKDWMSAELCFTLAEPRLCRLGLEATEETVAVYATDFVTEVIKQEEK